MKKIEWMKNERLLFLIDNHTPQIKSQLELARLLYDECFDLLNGCERKFVYDPRFNYNSPENNSYRQAVDVVNKRIKVDLRNTDFKETSGKYMLAYCKIFHCSADYLLGLIELPTHAETDINAKTGLSAEAIKQLIEWNDKSKLPYYDLYHNSILFISDLLECCGIQAAALAQNVYNYLLYRKISETKNLTSKITKGIYDKREVERVRVSFKLMDCLQYIYKHSKNIPTEESLQTAYPKTDEEKYLDEILG